MINSIFRAGVTIWKLNSDIGDNNVWNIIVTPSNSQELKYMPCSKGNGKKRP